jgi:hypothetical protein
MKSLLKMMISCFFISFAYRLWSFAHFFFITGSVISLNKHWFVSADQHQRLKDAR